MKKTFTISLLFFATTIISQIPTSGMIGGWPFTGNANDMSGTGNHGTVFGATLTNDRFGATNSAYHFNGSSNYIGMLSAGPTGTVSRSVSFWAKTAYASAVTAAFTYGLSGSFGAFQVNFNYCAQGVGIDNSNEALIRGNSTVNNNQWHHFAVVLNSTVSAAIGSIQIYIDGIVQPSITCSVTGTTSIMNTNASSPIRIGGDASSPRYFNGDLDDFYLYNRAITPAEVLQLYNYSPCSGAPTDPGPISGLNSLCSGASAIYSVSPVAGASSYTWSLPGGWTGTSSSNTISAIAGNNSGFISVTAGNPCGNSAAANTNVSVNPSPTVIASATNTLICNGNTTQLIGNGANTYTWNSFIVTPTLVVSPASTTTFTLAGTNSAGCIGTSAITISVTNNPLPIISVSGPSITCSGQSINLASNGASTYTWQPGNLNGFFVSVSPTVTTNYTVTGTDANNCLNSTVYTQSVAVCAAVAGVESLDKVLSIYPNPFKNEVTIHSNLSFGSVIEIYDIVGKRIYSEILKGDKTILNLSDKPSGIYFLRITGQSGSFTEKLIKE